MQLQTNYLDEALIRTRAIELIRTLGPSGAARALGVSRWVIMALASGGPVRAGSFALAREALTRGTAA